MTMRLTMLSKGTPPSCDFPMIGSCSMSPVKFRCSFAIFARCLFLFAMRDLALAFAVGSDAVANDGSRYAIPPV